MAQARIRGLSAYPSYRPCRRHEPVTREGRVRELLRVRWRINGGIPDRAWRRVRDDVTGAGRGVVESRRLRRGSLWACFGSEPSAGPMRDPSVAASYRPCRRHEPVTREGPVREPLPVRWRIDGGIPDRAWRRVRDDVMGPGRRFRSGGVMGHAQGAGAKCRGMSARR
jgi:hypothetical protein